MYRVRVRHVKFEANLFSNVSKGVGGKPEPFEAFLGRLLKCPISWLRFLHMMPGDVSMP